MILGWEVCAEGGDVGWEGGGPVEFPGKGGNIFAPFKCGFESCGGTTETGDVKEPWILLPFRVDNNVVGTVRCALSDLDFFAFFAWSA